MSFKGGLTMKDSFSRVTSKRFLSNRTALADVQSDLTSFVTLFEAISGAGAIQTDVLVETVVNDTPDAGSNLDAGATLHVRLDNGKLYPLRIPSIDQACVNADGRVDIENADVVAFVNQFMTGGHFRLADNHYVTALEYGELDR